MPKVSLASKDAYETKLGIQEGAVEIVSARTEVFQFPPNKESGEQSNPFLAAILGLAKLDDNGTRLDEDISEKILRIEKDLTKMRPGMASSRTDPDPADEGDELGTIGNCIYTESGAKINNKSQYSVFSKSLEDCGFKTDILSEGFFDDLIGLKGHVKTVAGEKATSRDGREFQANYMVFDKIWLFPYEAAVKGKAAAKTTAAKGKANGLAVVPAPAAATAAAPAAAPTPLATADALAESDDAADLVATQLLSELTNELTGESRDVKKVFSMAYSRLMKIKDRDRKLDKTVGELLKDENWISAKAEDIGYSFDDGVFTFGTLVGA
jgi:hypothetical protein